MTIQEERELFYLIASPITSYFKEQGVDAIASLPMTTEIAQRVFDNVRSNLESSKEKENVIQQLENDG